MRPVAATTHIAYLSAAALAAPGIVLLVPEPRRLSSFNGDLPLEFHKVIAGSLVQVCRKIPGEHKLLPRSMAAFWRLYAVPGMARKLQRALCVEAELKELQDHFNAPATARWHRQRLVSLASKNAGAWLTVIPATPELRLKDFELKQAVRLRLGNSSKRWARWCMWRRGLMVLPASGRICW